MLGIPCTTARQNKRSWYVPPLRSYEHYSHFPTCTSIYILEWSRLQTASRQPPSANHRTANHQLHQRRLLRRRRQRWCPIQKQKKTRWPKLSATVHVQNARTWAAGIAANVAANANESKSEKRKSKAKAKSKDPKAKKRKPQRVRVKVTLTSPGMESLLYRRWLRGFSQGNGAASRQLQQQYDHHHHQPSDTAIGLECLCLWAPKMWIHSSAIFGTMARMRLNSNYDVGSSDCSSGHWSNGQMVK